MWSMNTRIKCYSEERKHQALSYRTQHEISVASIACAYVHKASALHTNPQATQSETEKP
jgi:hypothetical protein